MISTPESEPLAAVADDTSPLRGKAGNGRLIAAFSIAALAWAVPFIGGQVVLMPAKLTIMDAANKSTLLGVVAIVGSIVALLANVIFGALSDRTRSKIGGRTGWILAGGTGMSLAVVWVSVTDTFPVFLLAWCVMQLFLNMYLAPMTAVIADRVAPRRQGVVSAAMGIGTTIAQTIGVIVAGSFAENPNGGFAVFAVFPIFFAVLFVLLAPDTSNADDPLAKLNLRVFLEAFSFPTKGARDFYWAFVGRLLLILGYFMVTLYQFYILTEYLHLDAGGAGGLLQIQGLIGLVTGILAGLVAGPLSDRIGKRKPMVIASTILLALGLVAPILMPTPTAMIIFWTLGGLGMGAYWAVDVALVVQLLPNKETQAKDLAVLNMANTGGQIIAPAVASLVVAVAGAGSYRFIFIVALVFVIAAAAVIIPIKSAK